MPVLTSECGAVNAVTGAEGCPFQKRSWVSVVVKESPILAPAAGRGRGASVRSCSLDVGCLSGWVRRLDVWLTPGRRAPGGAASRAEDGSGDRTPGGPAWELGVWQPLGPQHAMPGTPCPGWRSCAGFCPWCLTAGRPLPARACPPSPPPPRLCFPHQPGGLCLWPASSVFSSSACGVAAVSRDIVLPAFLAPLPLRFRFMKPR